MTDQLSRTEILALTSEIVTAYVSNNNIEVNNMRDLIHNVFNGLVAVDAAYHDATKLPKPAVPINKSVKDEYIICLEDGKKLQMLKRYLRTAYGMTVDQYKERWNLPSDYPVVAPNYAQRRSQIALDTGLGLNENSSRRK